MINNDIDIMNSINTSDLENFLKSTKANFISVSDVKETTIDYSWLKVLEETLPNIDTILRHPRKYIIEEDELELVEKTKKYSQKTIKNLAEHSENIQDINADNEIFPKKLLNILKDDTTDLYENRFIYTLVMRLLSFISRQLENTDLVSNKEIKREVSYNANTYMDNRKVNIELKIKDEEKKELDDFESKYKKRILRCYEIIKNFKSTEMIKSLEGCSLVRSPIRKTNIILREPNFQKANILWQYLDRYEFRDPKVVNYEKITDASKEIKDEFTLSYYIDCCALDNNNDYLMKYKNINEKFEKLINEYIYDKDENIDNLIERIKTSYVSLKNQKDIRINNIISLYKNHIEDHNKKLIELNNLFN